MANPLPSTLQTIDALRAREEAERAEKERGERRIRDRVLGRWAANLITPDETFDCFVTDLSVSGARLQLVAQLYRLQEVQLSLDGILPLNAEVMWRTRSNLGIRFTDGPVAIAEVIGPLLATNAAKP